MDWQNALHLLPVICEFSVFQNCLTGWGGWRVTVHQCQGGYALLPPPFPLSAFYLWVHLSL